MSFTPKIVYLKIPLSTDKKPSSTMVRRKLITFVERPEATPTLTLEEIKAEGNTPDAAVYYPDDMCIKYKDCWFELPAHLEDDWEIIDLFLHEQNGKQRMILQYEMPDSSYTFQKICQQVVVPDAEQKAKLEELLQKHGENVSAEAAQMVDALKRIDALSTNLQQAANAICPGFEIEKLHSKTEKRFPFVKPPNFTSWLKDAINLQESGVLLSKEEAPLLRKRKAPEEDE